MHAGRYEPAMEHAPTQRVDQQKLDEIVEREAEKPVDVAANEPPHAAKDIKLV